MILLLETGDLIPLANEWGLKKYNNDTKSYYLYYKDSNVFYNTFGLSIMVELVGDIIRLRNIPGVKFSITQFNTSKALQDKFKNIVRIHTQFYALRDFIMADTPEGCSESNWTFYTDLVVKEILTGNGYSYRPDLTQEKIDPPMESVMIISSSDAVKNGWVFKVFYDSVGAGFTMVVNRKKKNENIFQEYVGSWYKDELQGLKKFLENINNLRNLMDALVLRYKSSNKPTPSDLKQFRRDLGKKNDPEAILLNILRGITFSLLNNKITALISYLNSL